MTRAADQIAALRRAAGGAGGTSDFDLAPELRPAARTLRPAGVLIAFEEAPDGLRLFLTKRASGLKHHPGQIALPGGKVDPGDSDAVAAALREAEEEISLPRDNVEIIGTLPSHETVTGFSVTPVLGLVQRRFSPVAEAGEVEEIFTVPYPHIADPARYLVEGRIFRGKPRQFYTVPYGPYYIWGATARMLHVLAERLAR